MKLLKTVALLGLIGSLAACGSSKSGSTDFTKTQMVDDKAVISAVLGGEKAQDVLIAENNSITVDGKKIEIMDLSTDNIKLAVVPETLQSVIVAKPTAENDLPISDNVRYNVSGFTVSKTNETSKPEVRNSSIIESIDVNFNAKKLSLLRYGNEKIIDADIVGNKFSGKMNGQDKSTMAVSGMFSGKNAQFIAGNLYSKSEADFKDPKTQKNIHMFEERIETFVGEKAK